MIDLNFRRIDDLNAVRFDLHETLIYGYDTEYKEFWTSRLRQGSFKENRISFEAVQKAYADVYERYYNNYRRLFARRYYFVPITLIKPKHDYENLNAHFDFIEKLKKELMGEIYTVYQGITDLQEKKSVVYKGLSLVQHLAEVLRQAVCCSEEEREKNNREYYWGCLKVYEHRNIICRSMQWFLDTIDNDCERLRELVDRYRECCDKARVNVPLMQKYLITKDSRLLLRAADILENLLPVEREILAEFIEIAPEVYGRKRLVV